MATALDLGGFYSQLKSLLRLQARALSLFSRMKHTLGGADIKAESCTENHPTSVIFPSQLEISRWKKVDSRTIGVESSKIPLSSWLVLKILREKGFQAYLVGGCVRDLLLNKIPKDFDVITTANLKEIRSTFHHAFIVGRRFPICIVNIKGSGVEVSSFGTAAKSDKEGAKVQKYTMPRGCNKMDCIRWKDAMRRDFTINSLFYDPFSNSIYDYANGMKDLTSSKLRTIISADASFREDCARILRGLRIAARLGLSFSNDAEKAIYNLSFSVKKLDKSRLMMELNYMFSYGAAEHSLHLLQRFNLLEILLPIQNAYLNQYGDQASGKSTMLMKLFSSLDHVVACDKPCDCTLWIGILSFHQALVADPQDALVLWAFSSMLYYGNWSKAMKAAREHALETVDFKPEISKTLNHVSDEELVQRVSKFASSIQDSTSALSDSDCLSRAMARYPSSSCSGVALVSKKASEDVARIFDVLMDHNTESCLKVRKSYEINYPLLGKGNVFEKRFVMGKIIMDTLSSAVLRVREVKSTATTISEEKNQEPIDEQQGDKPVDVEEKVSTDSPDNLIEKMIGKTKRRKRTDKEESVVLKNRKADEILSSLNINKKNVDDQASFSISNDVSTTNHAENELSRGKEEEEKKKIMPKKNVAEENSKLKEHQEVVAGDQIVSAPQPSKLFENSKSRKEEQEMEANGKRSTTFLSSLFLK